MTEKAFFVTDIMLLADIAHNLLKEKLNELPVLDDHKRIIGQVNMYEDIRAYLDEKE